ncbi:helix-turn-helix domain-containing protein [Paraburkholderia rhynchosiae]|uniref:DNA binding HTH domain-containing protein n=1 Tax=Paraburkholderia rhynchosiae TaxID=487049 RepID=A0ABX4VBQ4_9BURK|nr:hypothetical protein C0Z16_03620 [Paraburkholderia rhynchosiae]
MAEALERCGQHGALAAALLGISRASLYRDLQAAMRSRV